MGVLEVQVLPVRRTFAITPETDRLVSEEHFHDQSGLKLSVMGVL
jgi:hypothetical protein